MTSLTVVVTQAGLETARPLGVGDLGVAEEELGRLLGVARQELDEWRAERTSGLQHVTTALNFYII